MAEPSLEHLSFTFLFTAACVLVVDQATKWLASMMAAPIPLLPFLSFTYSTNTGAAFGMLKGYSIVLAVIAAAVVILILFLLPKLHQHQVFPVALIWSGALGNLIDRLLFGTVRDFIAFSFWPNFNVADSAITIGVLWLVWVEWRKK